MQVQHAEALRGWGLKTFPCAQLANALGDVMLTEVEGGQLYAEALSTHLAREAEATRMLRLVTRLCQILERPEGDLDPQWAETGARNSP